MNISGYYKLGQNITLSFSTSEQFGFFCITSIFHLILSLSLSFWKFSMSLQPTYRHFARSDYWVTNSITLSYYLIFSHTCIPLHCTLHNNDITQYYCLIYFIFALLKTTLRMMTTGQLNHTHGRSLYTRSLLYL